MTKEHILPLSLGGTNKFCIKVNREYNKILGSKIDGKLSSDYLISCLRRRHNLRGHSNAVPTTKLTKVKMKGSDRPVQLIFTPNSKWVYDLINKRIIDENELTGAQYTISIPFDNHIRSLFIAKVALSVGYYVYGDTFRESADHESVRKYMEFAIHRQENEINNLNLRFLDHLTIPEDDRNKTIMKYFELLFKSMKGSAVKIALCSEHFLVSVAIEGTYIGTINFKADPTKFPNEGKFAGGKVLGVQNGQFRTSSVDFVEDKFRSVLLKKLSK